jgi:hypothetical protein
MMTIDEIKERIRALTPNLAAEVDHELASLWLTLEAKAGRPATLAYASQMVKEFLETYPA